MKIKNKLLSSLKTKHMHMLKQSCTIVVSPLHWCLKLNVIIIVHSICTQEQYSLPSVKFVIGICLSCSVPHTHTPTRDNIKQHRNPIYKPGLEEESIRLPSRTKGSFKFTFLVSAIAASLSNISATVMR